MAVHLDPSNYDVTPDVPILDEGDLVVPREDGSTETVAVTPALLREIRDNMNRKAENSGDLGVLAVGHVKRENGVDETSQAPVVGYAKNWKVKQRPTDSKWILTYDEYMRKEHADVPRKYPRRSPDLWLGRKEIDPVAYLGATTPHRDLGLHPLSLSRQGDTVLRVPYMADEKPDDKTKGDAKLIDALNEIVKSLAELKTEVQALAAGGPGAPAAEPEMSPEDAEAELNRLLGQKTQEPEPQEKPKQMARTDETPKTDEVAELKKKNDEMALQLARHDVTAKLTALATSGVLIPDMETEVTDLLALPAEMRVTQLARIEKNYRKAPGAKINPALENSTESQGKVDVKAVVSLARSEKIVYEKAREKLYGQATPEVNK